MLQNGQNTVNQQEINIHQNPLVRWVLIIGGIILVGIGVLGMFLPLLPTTIFFILAAWCFARSSEKFYKWLHYNKYFGKYLRTYREGGGMTLASKVISLSILWIGIAVSAVWGTENLYVRILLLAIAVGVSWHLLAIKTAKHAE
jgi:uncharacterized membrane protein YbaN (DUF454 family)